MLALFLALLAAVWLIDASGDIDNYQLHGAVVFTRTGERTPVLEMSASQSLTSLGAQQLYTVGEAFRGRYISSIGNNTGLGYQPIIGLSPNTIDNNQIYVMTLDEPYLVASAQAFMQGLYPPFKLDKTAAQALDNESDSGFLANGSYMINPLDGYQYAQIHVASDVDPNSVFLAGLQNCPTAQTSSYDYYNTQEFLDTRMDSASLYESVGQAVLEDVLAVSQWDYYNAYLIWDYLNYNYTHSAITFERYANDSSDGGEYEQIHWLANQQQWAMYGNLTADDEMRAISGKTLAALILGRFQTLIQTQGASEPLTLFFGEHEPFLSLFSLLELHLLNENFYGMPDYGSSIAFELFSLGNDSTFPTDSSDLWVRFHFHNGSDFSGSLQAFPMFGFGPSLTDMQWSDFEDLMSRVMMNTLTDWCSACDAPSLFCWGVDNDTYVINLPNAASRKQLSPTIAGVIGAMVTLGVLLLAFILAVLVGGIRFHSVNRGKKSELGGFKGSAKLASDADLNLPKNGAVAGITSFGDADDKKEPRERVGSWELRQKEEGSVSHGLGKDLGDGVSRRESLDDIAAVMKPVQPEERV